MGNFGITSDAAGRLDVQMGWFPNEGAVAKSVSTAIRQGNAYVLLPVSTAGFGGTPRDDWSPAGMFTRATLDRFRPLEALEQTMDTWRQQALDAVGGPTDPLCHLEFHAFVQGPIQSIEAGLIRLKSMGLNRFSHGNSQGAIWLSYSGLGFVADRQNAIDTIAAHYRRIRDDQRPEAVRMVKLGDEILPPMAIPDITRIDTLLGESADAANNVIEEFMRDIENPRAGGETDRMQPQPPDNPVVSGAGADRPVNGTVAERRRLAP